MTQQEPEELLNSELEAEGLSGIEDTEQLKQALAEEHKKAEGYLSNWQRAQADFINYKRRIEQEKDEFNKFANATLILSLLPAIDDLERAFDAIPPKLAKHSWMEGTRLIEQKIRTILEAQGLTLIKALGEPFDPRFHEAVRQTGGQEGMVIEEFQKGYMLGDKVLRPSKVVVGNGEEAEKEDK